MRSRNARTTEEAIMKLTPFGLCVRKLRLEAGCRLKDMADFIGCSSAYLSAVEVGKRPVSDDIVHKAITFFEERGIHENNQIIEAADKSRDSLNVNTLSLDERGVLAAFARRMPEADDAKRTEMMRKLEGILNGD